MTTDRALEAALAARFRALFAALDAEFPDTPKVLLTGAALGADLIAAEAALQAGDDWAVAAVLPFGRALFAEDFDPALDKKRAEGWPERFLEYARRFDRSAGSRAGHLIPGCWCASCRSWRPTAASRPRSGFPGLARVTTSAYRRNHYEQVGQYIAETATIMIAVMSEDEQPEKSEANGGTARVVAYRRAGRPDAPGPAVARRSTVLRREWPDVIPPPAGHVWLMDPRREDRTAGYPVKVLAPLTERSVEEVYAGHPGRDAAAERESYVGPLRSHEQSLARRPGGPGRSRRGGGQARRGAAAAGEPRRSPGGSIATTRRNGGPPAVWVRRSQPTCREIAERAGRAQCGTRADQRAAAYRQRPRQAELPLAGFSVRRRGLHLRDLRQVLS